VEEKVPSHIITSMDHLNSLSTYGTHPKEFDPEQVRPVLINLATIVKWYVKYKDSFFISQEKPEETKFESKESVDTREGIHKPKKKLILLLSVLLVVMAIVVALFVFNIIGGGKQTKEPEKSIAVLPFKSLSTDPEKQYLADGMMDAILLHLSKIEDLRVLSRTSTEQYKESDKTITEIGKELGVTGRIILKPGMQIHIRKPFLFIWLLLILIMHLRRLIPAWLLHTGSGITGNPILKKTSWIPVLPWPNSSVL